MEAANLLFFLSVTLQDTGYMATLSTDGILQFSKKPLTHATMAVGISQNAHQSTFIQILSQMGVYWNLLSMSRLVDG
jgi:ABC-type hemin transport system substrate-binding protein